MRVASYSYHTIAHQQLAPHRFEWMARQAEAAQIHLNFFPWVTVDDIPSVPHLYNETRVRWRNGRAVKPTELACSLAHLQLLRQLLSSTDDWYVIMEDDVEFPENIDAIVKSAIAVGRGRLIRLSALNQQPFETIAPLENNYQYIRYRQAPTSAGGYLISRSAAAVLADYCEQVRIVFDEMLRRTWEHRVASYGVWPCPITHSTQFTSAVGDRTRRYDHNNPFLKTYSRCCRFADGIRKRLIPPLD